MDSDDAFTMFASAEDGGLEPGRFRGTSFSKRLPAPARTRLPFAAGIGLEPDPVLGANAFRERRRHLTDLSCQNATCLGVATSDSN